MNSNLYNLRKAGFEKIGTKSDGLDIYAKGYWRSLYNPDEEREVVRYMDEPKYYPKRGLSQVVFNGKIS